MHCRKRPRRPDLHSHARAHYHPREARKILPCIATAHRDCEKFAIFQLIYACARAALDRIYMHGVCVCTIRDAVPRYIDGPHHHYALYAPRPHTQRRIWDATGNAVHAHYPHIQRADNKCIIHHHTAVPAPCGECMPNMHSTRAVDVRSKWNNHFN